jgi:hypothetical protein
VKIVSYICVLLVVIILLGGCMLIPKVETYEDHRGDWYEDDVKKSQENI